MKAIIAWLIKLTSITAVKSAVITGVVVAGVAAGTTAVVINSNNNEKPNTNDSQTMSSTVADTNTTNDAANDEQVQSNDNQPTSSNQQTTKPSQSTQNNTTNQNSNTSNNQNTTPQQPTPQPDPQYLTSCIIDGGPHSYENCPYSPPSTYPSDFVNYPCRNIIHNTAVACPSYKSVAQIVAQSYAIGSDPAGICQFRFGNIYRDIIVTNSSTTTAPDCLTATPIRSWFLYP